MIAEEACQVCSTCGAMNDDEPAGIDCPDCGSPAEEPL